MLRGARQVGKSWLVRELGKTFSKYYEINFEESSDAKKIFERNLDPQTILEGLSFFFSEKIIPGQSLLFLDEIQECPRAITALRYFKEKCPELHVVSAGSLVDFELEKTGVPVGRVEFCYVHPLSFGEFLEATGNELLREHCIEQKHNDVAHDRLLELFKNYLWLGGMPEVVQTWIDHKDPQGCQKIQDGIIETYIQDFNKYSKRYQTENVDRVFRSIPKQLGHKFIYTHVDRDLSHYQLKSALSLLIKAGVALPCYHSSGQGTPLGAQIDAKKFKIFFFDGGLAQRLLGLDLKSWFATDYKTINDGALAEQFVAQEAIAQMSSMGPSHIYYWHREDKKGNAEVDFIFEKNQKIIPVEVKAGVKGGLKSLNYFLQTHKHSSKGLKVSCNHYASYEKYHEIPFYGLEAWFKK